MAAKEMIEELLKGEPVFSLCSTPDLKFSKHVDQDAVEKLVGLVIEKCAARAESCAPKYQDMIGEGQRATVKRIADEIRKLAQ